MKVLVLCDDRWHPAATPRAGLAGLGESGFEFDWIENAHDWSAARMAEYSLVLLTKSNNVSARDETPWMTSEVEAALRDYVRAGNGLLTIHSGTAGYQETPILRSLLGGVFLRHPPQCQVTIVPTAGHPLVMGSVAFTSKDEHYFMALDDEKADLFLTSVSEHGSQPAGWTRQEGEGRVCVLTPGHNLEVWLQAEYQRLILNALAWCTRQ